MHIRSLEHDATFNRLTVATARNDRLPFTTVASKSIRDRRLTGARIPASKKEPAILFFADNRRATEVAKAVGISLDSARAVRDREHERIMKLRETLTREYERLWEWNIEAHYHKEAERQYQELWQEIFKKQKALKLATPRANSSRRAS